MCAADTPTIVGSNVSYFIRDSREAIISLPLRTSLRSVNRASIAVVKSVEVKSENHRQLVVDKNAVQHEDCGGSVRGGRAAGDFYCQ